MSKTPERQSRNRLLASFPPARLRHIESHLESVKLPRGMILARPSTPADYLYFPDCGVMSMVKTMHDGRMAEIGAVGIEGMVGIASLLGMAPSAFETIVQVDGYGRRLKASVLGPEIEKSHGLKDLMLRYMSYRVSQVAQTAACNRLHRLSQRCCRWLLTVHDNVQTPTFMLTHEFLALMMGVNRPALTLAVRALQSKGIINYQRASISIANRKALEEASCECYGSLKREYKRIHAK